jgi:hypothetical protein
LQVFEAHVAAQLARLGHDALGGFSLVETGRAVLRYTLVGRGQERVRENVAVVRRPAAGVEDRGQMGVVLVPPGREVRGDEGRDGESGARVLDRGLEQAGKTEAAEALAQDLPAADAAGHTPGKGAFAGDAREAEALGLLQRPGCGGAAARVQAVEPAVLLDPHDREQVAADAAARGLHQAQGGVRGDGSVDARAPGLEHVDSDQGSEWLARADQAALGDHGRAVAVPIVEAGRIARGATGLGRGFSLHESGRGRRPREGEEDTSQHGSASWSCEEAAVRGRQGTLAPECAISRQPHPGC